MHFNLENNLSYQQFDTMPKDVKTNMDTFQLASMRDHKRSLKHVNQKLWRVHLSAASLTGVLLSFKHSAGAGLINKRRAVVTEGFACNKICALLNAKYPHGNKRTDQYTFNIKELKLMFFGSNFYSR